MCIGRSGGVLVLRRFRGSGIRGRGVGLSVVARLWIPPCRRVRVDFLNKVDKLGVRACNETMCSVDLEDGTGKTGSNHSNTHFRSGVLL